MAGETYTLTYDASSAIAAKAQIDQLIASNVALEVVLDRVGPKLKNFAKGTAAGINAFAKAVKPLPAALGQVEAKLNSTNSAFRRTGAAGNYAATGVKAAGTAAATSGRAFDRAATNATRAANGVNNMGAAAAAAGQNY